jgi:hypothetical protein
MSAPPSDTAQPEPQTEPVPLALPAPPSEEQQRTRTLNVQEENKVQLDELGPLIVNSDGVSLFSPILSSCAVADGFFADAVKDIELEVFVADGAGTDGTVDREAEECAAVGQVEGRAGGGRDGGEGEGGVGIGAGLKISGEESRRRHRRYSVQGITSSTSWSSASGQQDDSAFTPLESTHRL